MSDKTKKILVVCANYFNDDETRAFVRELFSLDESNCLEAIVVDNSADLKTGADLIPLLEEFERLKIVHPEKNLGYFGAAAKGLKVYLETAELPDWVIVSNTDISFPEKDFFTKLVNSYDGRDAPAVIAPSIVSEMSGRNQNPWMRRRPPARRMLFYRWVFHTYPTFIFYQLLYLLKGAVLKHRTAVKKGLSTATIYGPHGAFIIFNRSYFNSGGTLDYPKFLFGEEFFVAETAGRLNQSVLFDPSLCVIHRDHATTGILRGRKLAAFQRESSKFIYKEYFSGQRAGT
jgi:GT2 family glycosyltransferase